MAEPAPRQQLRDTGSLPARSRRDLLLAVRPRIQGDGDPLPWSTTYVFLAPG